MAGYVNGKPSPTLPTQHRWNNCIFFFFEKTSNMGHLLVDWTK
ncbi:unnamed protein product [Spirodela intermedia]|uniref:Uncharacterized protein n=1 Tax=Spirodela intermedia TaxID=51605 RepID=A0A7I8IE86_SPIIN|nr:unnamed protein product [Spirodela intermedia]CAA6655413.1 unnamed protein product [Spirodela intermedia]